MLSPLELCRYSFDLSLSSNDHPRIMYVYKKKKKKIVSTQNSKFDFTVDEGKEWLNPSREKN